MPSWAEENTVTRFPFHLCCSFS